MRAKIQSSSTEGKLTVSIDGLISETTVFPNTEQLSKDIDTVCFRFTDSAYLNSEGVKIWLQWMKWLRAALPAAKIHFEVVPVNVLNLGAIIAGLIPADTTFSTIRISYFCSYCGNNEMADFSASESGPGSEQSRDHLLVKTCSNCNKSSDLDAIFENVKKYF